MKKLIALLIILTLALSLVPLTAGAADSIVDNVGGQPITVYLDGQPINFEYQPLVVNGVLYVPLYAFCAALPMGCSVSYDSAAQIATLDAPGVHLGMTVGANVMAWNYVNMDMNNPMRRISNVLYVPAETIADVFGYGTLWYAESDTAIILSMGTYVTISDWNENDYFIGHVSFSSGANGVTDTEIGIVYDKATGFPRGYGIFESGNPKQGAAFFEDGAYYIGEWQNGLYSGYGEYHWAYGDYYIGEWQNNERNGHGEYHWADGTYYIGENQNGQRSGYGEQYFSNGDYYKGYWKDDKLNGFSEYHWRDGRYYVGMFVDDEMTGHGTMYYPDGYKLTGYWSDGVYVGP